MAQSLFLASLVCSLLSIASIPLVAPNNPLEALQLENPSVAGSAIPGVLSKPGSIIPSRGIDPAVASNPVLRKQTEALASDPAVKANPGILNDPAALKMLMQKKASLQARADEPAAPAAGAATVAPTPAAAPPAAPGPPAVAQLQPILGISGDVSAHLNLTVSVGRKRRAVEGWNDFAEHLVEDSDVIKSTKELSRE